MKFVCISSQAYDAFVVMCQSVDFVCTFSQSYDAIVVTWAAPVFCAVVAGWLPVFCSTFNYFIYCVAIVLCVILSCFVLIPRPFYVPCKLPLQHTKCHAVELPHHVFDYVAVVRNDFDLHEQYIMFVWRLLARLAEELLHVQSSTYLRNKHEIWMTASLSGREYFVPR